MEKKSVGLLELETAALECFLEKTPLSPLGVKERYTFPFKQQDPNCGFDSNEIDNPSSLQCSAPQYVHTLSMCPK
jgi:hypothetical protein